MDALIRRVCSSGLLAVALAGASCSSSKSPQGQVEQPKSPPAAQPSQASALPANPPQAHAALAVAAPVAETPADARRPDRILRSGHSGDIEAVAFSPDGRWLASGSDDKTIRIWDVSTGRTLCTLVGHTDLVWSLAFSPDAKLLASASQDGTTRVWDTGTWGALYTLNSGAIPVSSSFSTDGQFLIVSEESKEEEDGGAYIEIRKSTSGEVVRTIALDWNVAQLLVVTRDGGVVASGGAGEDGDVGIATKTWNLKTGQELRSLPLLAQAASSDGRWLASLVSGADGTTIALRDAHSGKLVRTIPSPDRAVGHLIFTPDCARLLFARGNGPVSGSGSAMQVWDVATGKELETLPGEKNASIRALAISPDGKFLAAGSYYGYAIRIWDLGTASVLRTLDGNSFFGSVAFDREGRLLVSEPSGLRIWNASTGEEVATIPGVGGGKIVFSSDGNWLASNPQGALKAWNARSWAAVDLAPPPRPVWYIDFAGSQLPRGIADSDVKSWQFGDKSTAASLVASTYAIAISPDKKLLAVGHARGGDVDIWDLAASAKLITLAATQVGINRLEFSPDGNLLLTSGQETRITPAMMAAHQFNFQSAAKLWEVRTWTAHSSFSLSGLGVGIGDFSPDGRLLVFSRPGVIELLDVNSGKIVRRLAASEYPGANMAFSPGGDWLASFTQRGVYLWKLDSR